MAEEEIKPINLLLYSNFFQYEGVAFSKPNKVVGGHFVKNIL